MTKKDEKKTEYSLATSWRLKQLPTAEGVSKLVEQKIITPEQAKELLFSKPEDPDLEKTALKEQVKFLLELVEKLSHHQRGITLVPYSQTITTPLIYWKNLTTYSSGSSNALYEYDKGSNTMWATIK